MSEVFDLVYHGNGGFTWNEVWSMPVPHRRFSLRKIEDFLKKVENERNTRAQELTAASDPKKYKMPDEVKRAMENGPNFTSTAKKSK